MSSQAPNRLRVYLTYFVPDSQSMGLVHAICQQGTALVSPGCNVQLSCQHPVSCASLKQQEHRGSGNTQAQRTLKQPNHMGTATPANITTLKQYVANWYASALTAGACLKSELKFLLQA